MSKAIDIVANNLVEEVYSRMTTDNGNDEEFQDEVEEEEATGDVFDCVTENGYFHKLSPISKSFFLIVAILLVSAMLYGWDAEVAEDEIVEDIEQKTLKETAKPIMGASPTEPPSIAPKQIVDVGSCSNLCEKRESNRKAKFGGDILDPKDVVRLAKAARDETIAQLKIDYGEYFDSIFVKEDTKSNAEPSYYGMEGVTPDGPSRDRLKRKLKLKVLKMMSAVRTEESDLNGCDCINGGGQVTGQADESIYEPSDYYEKYVFANGGHSQGKRRRNVDHYLGAVNNLTHHCGNYVQPPVMGTCSVKVTQLTLAKMSNEFGNPLESSLKTGTMPVEE